ncbi:MAG: hypothetical protein V2B18_23895 [Pseudomonadota bacterium]
MLRRIPATPLVCLLLWILAFSVGHALAEDPEKSLEILLKPKKTADTVATQQAASEYPAAKSAGRKASAKARQFIPMGPYGPITKVKPLGIVPQPVPCAYKPECLLPKPAPGQWDISAQVLFARVKSTLLFPYSYGYSWGWGGYWGEDYATNLTDQLRLPKHMAIPQISAKYQFRPSWAVQYSVLGWNVSGGGYTEENIYFQYPYWNLGPGLPLSTKWEHAYHKLGLVYDPIRTCNSLVSLSANWVHSEDKLQVNCTTCGYGTSIWSKSGDAAMVGVQFQRCIKTASNGGTLSWDHKAGVMFMDNIEGWDVEAGMRYSVPLNSGRAGYLKGGYRYIDYKKSQNDFKFVRTLEGGFLELGMIF